MSANLYRYPLQPTAGPAGSTPRPLGDDIAEIAVLDDWAYIACDAALPEQPHLTLEPVAQTPELLANLVAASPRHRFLLGALAARRYLAETAGITVSGLPVATDRESRPNLIAAYHTAVSGLRQDGAVWKFADGVARPVSNAAMQGMALSVLAHVQACFDREAEVAEAIRASLLPDESVLSDGWPA